MAYQRKTRDEWIIEGYWYGQWELETTEDTRRAAREQLRLYRESQPETLHRLRKVRVRIEKEEC